MAQDYSRLGLTNRLRPENSISGRERIWHTEYDQDIQFEKGPYANPVVVNKGTIELSTLQGSITLSGTITGGVINTTISAGTINNAVLGTPDITGGTADNFTLGTATVGTSLLIGGTIRNPTIGTPAISGGTCNVISYLINGTLGVSATAAILDAGTITHTLIFEKGLLVNYGTS